MLRSNFRDLWPSSHGVYSESLASQGGIGSRRAAWAGGSGDWWCAEKSRRTVVVVVLWGWSEHDTPEKVEDILAVVVEEEWVQRPTR